MVPQPCSTVPSYISGTEYNAQVPSHTMSDFLKSCWSVCCFSRELCVQLTSVYSAVQPGRPAWDRTKPFDESIHRYWTDDRRVSTLKLSRTRVSAHRREHKSRHGLTRHRPPYRIGEHMHGIIFHILCLIVNGGIEAYDIPHLGFTPYADIL